MPAIVVTAHRATSDVVFAELAKLYLKKKTRVVDMTYGRGFWWRKLSETDYKLTRLDIQAGDQATKTNLPRSSVGMVCFDPPFLKAPATAYKSVNRFRTNYNLGSIRQVKTHDDLLRFYDHAAREASRILKAKGLLVVKCQDQSVNGRQRLTHVDLINRMPVHGFKLLDLFVMLRKGPPLVPKQNQRQKVARKNHSYFLVFSKPSRRRLPIPTDWDRPS